MQWHLFKQPPIYVKHEINTAFCPLCIEMKLDFWHLLLKLIYVWILIRCEGVGKNLKFNKRLPPCIKHPRSCKVSNHRQRSFLRRKYLIYDGYFHSCNYLDIWHALFFPKFNILAFVISYFLGKGDQQKKPYIDSTFFVLTTR